MATYLYMLKRKIIIIIIIIINLYLYIINYETLSKILTSYTKQVLTFEQHLNGAIFCRALVTLHKIILYFTLL